MLNSKLIYNAVKKGNIVLSDTEVKEGVIYFFDLYMKLSDLGERFEFSATEIYHVYETLLSWRQERGL